MTTSNVSFDIKEYERATYGRVVKGTLYDFNPFHREYAAELIGEKLPKGCVPMWPTLKTKVWFVIEEPHPECRAAHDKPQPQWYTGISVDVFPDVSEDHRKVVETFGEKNLTVRVPIMKELTFDDFRGMA